ncbi:class I adenylate-forming enzyme family protein [Limnohabitans sp. 2KL-1]|uniref:class I adenylate-forming enzyme family protein n=1 Tax=Limnohabitans sp. 2KL-1 TaxID=1100699 RepID=UPI001304E11B|nr:class I adenylate-forming enzyme family protein [Limnohabitans sp. 2KL-1]
MKNLTIDLLETADVFPDKVAVTTESGDLTYKALRLEVVVAAAHLREAGITAGTGVGLALKHPIDALVAVLAIGLIGARWMTFPGRDRKEALVAMGVTHVVASSKEDAKPTEGLDPRFKLHTWSRHRDPELVKLHAADIRGRAPLESTWYMAVTSGTTGTPKMMNLSYANYWARNKKGKLTHDFDPVITCNLFPPLSGPWLSYNLRTLALQGTLVMSRNFAFLRQKNVQKLFGSPSQYASYLKSIPADVEGKLPIAHVAGATLSKVFAQQILERFEIIHNFYGGTEVGGIARNVIRSAEDNLRCVGRVLEGNEVEVVDTTGNVQMPKTVGLIRVRNNIMVQQYANNPTATQECFKNGWFYSGDTGYFDESGLLYVTGRANDVLNIGGTKVDPHIIDDALTACESVAEALTFKGSFEGKDKLAALIVPVKGSSSQQLRADIASAMSGLPRHQRVAGVLYVNDLPRNANGKPVRALAQKLAAGHKFLSVAFSEPAPADQEHGQTVH